MRTIITLAFALTLSGCFTPVNWNVAERDAAMKRCTAKHTWDFCHRNVDGFEAVLAGTYNKDEEWK